MGGRRVRGRRWAWEGRRVWGRGLGEGWVWGGDGLVTEMGWEGRELGEGDRFGEGDGLKQGEGFGGGGEGRK